MFLAILRGKARQWGCRLSREHTEGVKHGKRVRFGSVSSLLRMQNSKRVIHPLIKHRLNAKLQKKINVADTIGTWKIVRGDTVFRLFCAVMGVGGGD